MNRIRLRGGFQLDTHPFPAHAGMNRTRTPMSWFSPMPFPAHAGMNRVSESMIPVDFTVPRTRGDEPSLPRVLAGTFVLRSPHTRG